MYIKVLEYCHLVLRIEQLGAGEPSALVSGSSQMPPAGAFADWLHCCICLIKHETRILFMHRPGYWITSPIEVIQGRHYQNYQDEDLIRRDPWHITIKLIAFQVKAVVGGLHVRVFSLRALEHYCIAMCLRWTKGF